jgi:hypothetical protein
VTEAEARAVLPEAVAFATTLADWVVPDWVVPVFVPVVEVW